MYLSYRECIRSGAMSTEDGREPVRSYDRSWSEIEEMLRKLSLAGTSGRNGLTNAAKTEIEMA